MKFYSALFGAGMQKIIWFWSIPNKFWPVRWKKAITLLSSVHEFESWCCKHAKIRSVLCFSRTWTSSVAAQPNLSYEGTAFVEQLWEVREGCTQEKEVHPSLWAFWGLQPEAVLGNPLLGVRCTGNSCWDRSQSENTNNQVSLRSWKWADLLEAAKHLPQMQGLTCLLVRSWGGSNFR